MSPSLTSRPKSHAPGTAAPTPSAPAQAAPATPAADLALHHKKLFLDALASASIFADNGMTRMEVRAFSRRWVEAGAPEMQVGAAEVRMHTDQLRERFHAGAIRRKVATEKHVIDLMRSDPSEKIASKYVTQFDGAYELAGKPTLEKPPEQAHIDIYKRLIRRDHDAVFLKYDQLLGHIEQNPFYGLSATRHAREVDDWSSRLATLTGEMTESLKSGDRERYELFQRHFASVSETAKRLFLPDGAGSEEK